MFYVHKHGGLLFSPLPPHTRPRVDAVASDSVGGVVHHHQTWRFIGFARLGTQV